MAAYTDVKPLMTDTITESISQLLLQTNVESGHYKPGMLCPPARPGQHGPGLGYWGAAGWGWETQTAHLSFPTGTQQEMARGLSPSPVPTASGPQSCPLTTSQRHLCCNLVSQTPSKTLWTPGAAFSPQRWAQRALCAQLLCQPLPWAQPVSPQSQASETARSPPGPPGPLPGPLVPPSGPQGGPVSSQQKAPHLHLEPKGFQLSMSRTQRAPGAPNPAGSSPTSPHC